MAEDSADRRLGDKLDAVDRDVRGLTAAIHEQSLAITELCGQMRQSMEAIGAAHHGIERLDRRYDALRDLPLRMTHIEREVERHADAITALNTSHAYNSTRLGQREAVATTIYRFSPWLAIGAVVTALAVLGAAAKLIN